MTSLIASRDVATIYPGDPTASLPTVARLTVSVRDVAIDADIGVYPHEVGVAQPLGLSVSLDLDPAVPASLDDTVDYDAIVAAAVALGRERIGLVETFAYRLARQCLEWPGVACASVRVDKPGALTSGTAAARIVLRR